MSRIYIDSSAFVKLIVAEPESPALRNFLANRDLVSSGLLRTEAIRAIRRTHESLVSPTLSAMERIDLIEVSPSILEVAALIDPPTVRSLDAIHLATAIRIGQRGTTFVAYDLRLLSAARELGFTTASPKPSKRGRVRGR